MTRPFEFPPPDGYSDTPEHPLIGVDRHFRLAEQVQRAFPGAPIIGSGYSYLQEFMVQAGAANIRDGRITIVGVGRATLAQPDFVRQIQEHGKLDRKPASAAPSATAPALMRLPQAQQACGQFWPPAAARRSIKRSMDRFGTRRRRSGIGAGFRNGTTKSEARPPRQNRETFVPLLGDARALQSTNYHSGGGYGRYC